MPLVIALLLGLSGILVVLYPLLGLEVSRPDVDATEPLGDVAERERVAKRALRDVDFDYRLGNLDTDDYESLRQRYERRALAALATRYDREQALDTLIDAQLDALRATRNASDVSVTSHAPVAEPPSEGTSATRSTVAKQQTARRGPQARRRKGA